MKYKLFFLLFITINLHAFAQFSESYKASIIVLKTGDTLTGKGKTKKKGFKYKADSNAKPYFIEFSKIDYIQQRYSKKKVIDYKFFKFGNDKNYSKLERLIKGKNAELFVLTSFSNLNAFGGFSPTYYEEFFIKRFSQKNPRRFGSYDIFSNKLKRQVMSYFSDCPELVEKIKTKEFKMSDGLEQVVIFYNEHCNPK